MADGDEPVDAEDDAEGDDDGDDEHDGLLAAFLGAGERFEPASNCAVFAT